METQKLTVGDTVIYSTSGVCRVNDIVSHGFGREKRDYYELIPVFDARSTCYIPVDYDAQRVHIEPALSKERAEALLAFAAEATPLSWIAAPNERKQIYGNICKKGSREEKICLIKALARQEKIQQEHKKQLYAFDARMLSGCRSHICNELAYVLGKTAEEMETLLEKFSCQPEKATHNTR